MKSWHLREIIAGQAMFTKAELQTIPRLYVQDSWLIGGPEKEEHDIYYSQLIGFSHTTWLLGHMLLLQQVAE